MAKFGRRIRFRGTTIEGSIFESLVHNGERVYQVHWDHDVNLEPRPYRGDELEPMPSLVERQNLQIIIQAHRMDRKDWEYQLPPGGTVEEREQWRPGDGFQRI